MSMEDSLVYRPDELAWAWGQPGEQAVFKSRPEDFCVDEVLGFEPDGHGEHLFWRIQKRGVSTPELARHLALKFNLPLRSITWSGLKDKQAVTTQWIGLHVGLHESPDPQLANTDNIRVLESFRNSRKLRNGVHSSNRFRILLRDYTGIPEQLNARLDKIKTFGVPNYFGPQRFGNDGANALRALAMMKGESKVKKRTERSILLSAARSWLFNEVLSRRVKEQCWHTMTDGDVMQLSGSQVSFTPDWSKMNDAELAELEHRLETGDIFVTGPLWGKGKPPTTGNAAIYESRENLPQALCAGLEQAGMKPDRRALALRPDNLHAEPASDGGLVIEFGLARSGYATSVLRELVVLKS